ncbi:MAG: radical SAM protein [Clostridiales bacterium]|nr:radical SAM protein [Clostridiales bacterium]MDO4350072.1 radical SAM protein [Eubacteriales bacterium]MDY4009447.1 radical SAM protein [Candidatus Limiplasma sp.]
MHFTGTIWRPPYEAGSLLIEVTAGCTHHRCKFCTLYDDLPFSFRVSPMETVESDLAEAQMLCGAPDGRMRRRLFGLESQRFERAYLVGGNPFALSFARLARLAGAIRRYFPGVASIGCFARVTDAVSKTDGELRKLRQLGYDGLTIGVETGDEQALAFMDKGYTAKDILTQCSRLDEAGIGYHFFYLAGISGAGRGKEGAALSAKVFNRLHPRRIGSSMLTVFPQSRLYQDIQRGLWMEESEMEKLDELQILIEQLAIPVYFASLGASNALWVEGQLPRDREKLLGELHAFSLAYDEAALRSYRDGLEHL